MPFRPNFSEKYNARNIKYMTVLIFRKFFDFEQNTYTRTSSYLFHWTHKNMVSTFNEEVLDPGTISYDFVASQAELLESIDLNSATPFPDQGEH